MKWPKVDYVFLCQWDAVLLGLVSAVLLGRGSFLLSPDTLADLASTKFGYNPTAIESLAGQAADTRAGTLLLVISVVFQVAALQAPKSAHGKSARRWAGSLALAIVLVAVVWAGVYSERATRQMVEQVRRILADHADENRIPSLEPFRSSGPSVTGDAIFSTAPKPFSNAQLPPARD